MRDENNNLKALEQMITRILVETTEETRTISVTTENAVDVELELGYESEDGANGASLELAFSYAWAKEHGAAETKSRSSVFEISPSWLRASAPTFLRADSLKTKFYEK